MNIFIFLPMVENPVFWRRILQPAHPGKYQPLFDPTFVAP